METDRTPLSDEKFKSLMFDKPIPGQSLVNSTDKKLPFERAPEYTNVDKAQKYLFESMVDAGEDVVDLVASGVPVTTIAMSTVMKGFSTGKWNPDVMLMLIEPAIYTTLFIAEQAGVDYVLDTDEEADHIAPDSKMKADNHLQQALKQVSEKVASETQSKPVEELLPPSLLGKTEEMQNG